MKKYNYYEDGFVNGWKRRLKTPKFKTLNNETDYRVGFIAGMNEKKKRQSEHDNDAPITKRDFKKLERAFERLIRR